MNMWIVNRDELYHFGTPGQRWGIRKYQNEDGSLTPEGREHYGYGDERAPLSQRIKDYMTYRDEEGKLHLSEKGKRAAIGTAGLIGTAATAAGAGILYRQHVKSYGQGNYKLGKTNLKAIKATKMSTREHAKNLSFDDLRKHRYSAKRMASNAKSGKSIFGFKANPQTYTKDVIKKWKTIDREYAKEYHKRLVQNSLRNLIRK